MLSHIKQGDIVQIKEVSGIHSWNLVLFRKEFNLHVSVDRTTKTQIIIGGNRYRKETGVEIKTGYGGGRIFAATDRKENEEMNAYKSELRDISNLIRGLPRQLDGVNFYSCKSLDDVRRAVKVAKELISVIKGEAK